MEALERVQKIFTRIMPKLEGISYKGRLGRLGLFSPEHQKLNRVYKVMRGVDRVDKTFFPEWKDQR